MKRCRLFKRERCVCGDAKKRGRLPKIVKEIRTQYDDVVWVSASLDGSRLKFKLKKMKILSRRKKKER